VQGGAAPVLVRRPAAEVAIDPYGPESPEFVVGEDFVRMWTSALAHCHKRFEGKRPLYRREPSGGIGAFTPDSFPVFDVFRQNAYVIADSNHGYKMLGVGELVAGELLGEPSALLEPFRFSRYETGRLHPTSNSPFPWS
jgi:glycine/D-amino acid oxidase-like deaminating enzyme